MNEWTIGILSGLTVLILKDIYKLIFLGLKYITIRVHYWKEGLYPLYIIEEFPEFKPYCIGYWFKEKGKGRKE